MTNKATATSIAATAIRLNDGTEIDIDQYSELLTTEICKQIGAALKADFMYQLSRFEDDIARMVACDDTIQANIKEQTARVIVDKLEEASGGRGTLPMMITDKVVERILDKGTGDSVCMGVVDKARRMLVTADLSADGALAYSIADAMFTRDQRLSLIFATAVKRDQELRSLILREMWTLNETDIIEALYDRLTNYIHNKLSDLMANICKVSTDYRAAANTYKAQRDALKEEYEAAATNMRDVQQRLTDLRRDLDGLITSTAPIECPELFPGATKPDRD